VGVSLLAASLVTLLPVPFVPQVRDTCGAAALTMVLRYWDAPVQHDDVAATLLDPELHGIPGSELARFARGLGFTAVAYRGDATQLREYLAKGRPLIVAWEVDRDRFHDVVVVGFDAERHEILVNDPAAGAARRISERSFEKRWAGAGHWTLLVIPAAR
jgi:ABC-type bacteriocin/lantibiotic exporter with double-glycine peptidase domain